MKRTLALLLIGCLMGYLTSSGHVWADQFGNGANASVFVHNTVYVTGVAGGGAGTVTAFIANTPGVVVISQPSAIITGTVNVNVAGGGETVAVNNTMAVTLATAGFVAVPTQSYDVNVKNTPAIQGSVSINNTPAVQIGVTPWVFLVTPVVVATPTYAVNAFQGATFAIATPTYNVNAFINGTPAIQGSVSINNTPQVQFATADPCENPGIAKSFVALATASATTSPLVAVNGSQAVYVCGFSFSEPQGVGTVGVQFMNAVNTPCSSLTPLTGIYALGLTHPGGYSVFKAAQNLCIQKTGAGVDPEGGLSYVQQ